MLTALAILALVTLGEPSLPPAGIAQVGVTCPVCRHSFEAFAIEETNQAAGIDRDLFARAIGPQPEFYRVSTCPGCLYSGYLSDFADDAVVPPFVVEQVQQAGRLTRPPGFTPDSGPRDIDASTRYVLAIQCYEWRQAGDEALAWLHLRASWVVRDMAAVVPRDDRLDRVIHFAQRWRPTSTPNRNPAEDELTMVTAAAVAAAEGRFTRFQEPFVRFFIAMLLRRHGENRHAVTRLDALTQNPLLLEPLRAAATRMAESIEAEQRHQRQALAHFERALLAEEVSPANRAAATYLAAELCRRLGREREAVRWFDGALADESLPAELRRWANEQRTAIARPEAQ